MIYREVQAKSILSRSGLGGADFTLNPYTGCAHHCVYCYASFMARFSHRPEPWGTFVDVKANAPELVAREIARRPTARIFVSSVTDAYQPIERRYRLTERCLRELARYPLVEVSVLTKSALVLRDREILARMPGVRVGFTLSTLDDAVGAWAEPGASPPSRRLEALRALRRDGIAVWAFLGPLLPGLSDGDQALAALLEATADAGVEHVYVDKLNLYSRVRAGVLEAYRGHAPEALGPLREALRDEASYAEDLRARVRRLAAASGIDVRGLC